MRVEFHTTEAVGFFSRVWQPPITIDLGTLSEQARAALLQLVAEARFFELPSRVPVPRGGDDRTCHITIEYMGRRHTVSVNDPVPGPALQKLINRLRELSRKSA